MMNNLFTLHVFIYVGDLVRNLFNLSLSLCVNMLIFYTVRRIRIRISHAAAGIQCRIALSTIYFATLKHLLEPLRHVVGFLSAASVSEG